MSALWLPLPIGVVLLWLGMRLSSPFEELERSEPLEVPELPSVLVQFLLGRGSLPAAAVEDLVADVAGAGLVRIVERRGGEAAVSPCDGPPGRAVRPYERLLLQRVGQRRGGMAEVPVSALGPGDGEFASWWREVNEAVAAVAVRAGLVRRREVDDKRLDRAATALWAASGVAYLLLGMAMVTSILAAMGTSAAALLLVSLTLPKVRLSPEGRAAADWWRAAG
ncbi:hypothetical protein, partial [Kitasatospora sp. NPDC093558]|uniref:hypothetical protein n=1 Tax=Kitasatospora sp. NPDC093558 TaxID=3155201 RepID=UPI003418A956